MYYVYKIHFKKFNSIYIGCTNNICRRKDQHNCNAKNPKCYFAEFLSRTNITLTKKDFQIIAQYKIRSEALLREKREVESLIGTGIHILNDVYSDHCSLVGLKGEKNPSAKSYVVVDTKTQTYIKVSNMRKYSEEINVSYKSLIGTAHLKTKIASGRYIARITEEWDKLNDEEKTELLNGEWYKKEIAKGKSDSKAKHSKRYKILTPSGETIEVENLDEFARQNGINSGNLHATFSKNKKACGYKVIERLSASKTD